MTRLLIFLTPMEWAKAQGDRLISWSLKVGLLSTEGFTSQEILAYFWLDFQKQPINKFQICRILLFTWKYRNRRTTPAFLANLDQATCSTLAMMKTILRYSRRPNKHCTKSTVWKRPIRCPSPPHQLRKNHLNLQQSTATSHRHQSNTPKNSKQKPPLPKPFHPKTYTIYTESRNKNME